MTKSRNNSTTKSLLLRVLLFLRPQPSTPDPSPIYFSTAPSPSYFFMAPMYQNYFFMVPSYQNYYFLAMLVENISSISVLSNFQTFQLKEDKICN